MNAKWYFADLRWAMVRLQEIQRLLLNEGEDWHQPGGAPKTIPDPTGARAMRHLASMASLLEEKASILAQREEALLIIAGVGGALGSEHAELLMRYYVKLETWDEVAEGMGISRRTCIRMRDWCLEWIDSVGFAHAKNGLGAAEK